MTHDIGLIVGLGNPGSRYAANRHNLGAQFIARLQAAKGFSLTHEKRFQAAVGSVDWHGRKVRVAVPSTFMNLSGESIAPLAAFYRIPPAAILVIHDELDFAPGWVRLKRAGGHGGHNGLRDLVARLGSGDFTRLRIGIGHPGVNRDVANYVLNDPSAPEQLQIEQSMERALGVLDDVVAGDFAAAMERLHSEPAEKKPIPKEMGQKEDANHGV